MIDTVRRPVPPTNTASKTRKRRRTEREIAFREAVWRRDAGRDRATGRILYRQSEDWDSLGEVCHLLSRGAHPDLAYVVSNGILLSKANHWLSDARGGHALRISDPETGERATDAGTDVPKPLTFTLLDRTGRILWTRTA